MAKVETYVGVDNDIHGGMTAIAKVVRDAQVFGLIAENETCKGWNLAGIEILIDKVNAEWDKYGCLVSHLPQELAERHSRIHGEAIDKAKVAGWSGEFETGDETQLFSE